MPSNAAFRRWLIALVLCATMVALCMAYVDRPLVEFFEAHVRHTALWVWLDLPLHPIGLIVFAALIFLCGCGIWTISGRPLGGWTESPLLCSWAAMWAVAAEMILKRIFGRGWPDPTYVQQHLYGFHPLTQEAHWGSFPSGTAAVSAAIVSVLWMLRPRFRAPGAAIVVFLLADVVITNYHWLSDVIAGAFLGVTVGWSTVRLMRPPDGRQTSHGGG